MSDSYRHRAANQVSVEILRRQRLLSSLDDNALSGIAAHVRTRQFKRRDIVVNRGAPGTALMFLLSGRLQQISFNEDGREVGLGFIEPGEYFGLLSIIDGHPQTVSIVAVTDALVGFLDRDHAERFLLRSVEVTYLLLCQLCESIRQGFDDRSKLGVTSSRARVYAVLASMITASRDGIATIEKPPSQRAIAITATVSRETVSRALNLLVDNQIIRKDHGRYLVLDEQALHRAARGELEFNDLRACETRGEESATEAIWF